MRDPIDIVAVYSRLSAEAAVVGLAMGVVYWLAVAVHVMFGGGA